MIVRPAREFAEFRKVEIEQSISSRFEHQVARHAARPAVQTGSRTLSYAELNEQANRVAHSVLDLRGEVPEPVVLLLDQGAPMVAAILGALKAGKFYVPLDPDSPSARIAGMLDHSQAALVISDRKNRPLAEEVAGASRQVVSVDAIGAGANAENPGLDISPDSPAYIFYTSGSTGEPKGVVNNHRNVLHNILRYTNGLGIGAEDRLTLLQRPSFHGTVSNIFCALLNGGAICPFSPWQGSADELADWVLERRPTVWHSVPTLFRRLCSAGRQYPSLRVIRLEGDRGSPRDAELYRKHFSPDCSLVHGLASTETGITSRYVVGRTPEFIDSVLPIGYPVEDVDILLLAGEIAIRSRYLATGYWRQPELTRQRFQPCPDDGAERIYYTGDLGRMRPDGCLEHLGRKDFQVKIQGNTIEVAEVEAALASFEEVDQAIVTATEDEQGEKRLVAYIVPAARPGPTVSAVRHYLAARLPSYMIPSLFVELESLPLNLNGKVDCRALPAPSGSRPRLDTPFAAPRTATENKLSKIWNETLGLERIGIDDDFFELGGQSLDAGEMLSSLDLSVPAFLDAPTIRGMAARLDGARIDPDSALLTPIQTAGSKPPLFCVPGHTGVLLGFASLARCLPDQPLFGFHSPSIEDTGQAYSLQDLAARYLEEMRGVQPSGPYRLCGHCFGGWVAYEMACQLADQGEPVAMLAMLDCYHDIWVRNIPVARLLPQRFRHAARRTAFHLRTIARLGPSEGLSHFKERISAAMENGRERRDLKEFHRLARESKLLPPRLRQSRFANQAAVNGYVPRPYRGQALLLGGSAPRAGMYPRPLMGWDGLLLGEVAAHTIPSDIRGLLAEPAVEMVASRLAYSIEAAELSDGPLNVASR